MFDLKKPIIYLGAGSLSLFVTTHPGGEIEVRYYPNGEVETRSQLEINPYIFEFDDRIDRTYTLNHLTFASTAAQFVILGPKRLF